MRQFVMVDASAKSDENQANDAEVMLLKQIGYMVHVIPQTYFLQLNWKVYYQAIKCHYILQDMYTS